MFDIQAVITRLQGNAPALLSVQGAADLAKSRAAPRRRPAAFVYLLSEDASANRKVSAVDQRVAVRFATLLVVKNVADARGEAAMGSVAPVRESVRTALLGWEPPGDRTPVEYGNGRLMAMADGLMWWQDTWTSAYHVRAT